MQGTGTGAAAMLVGSAEDVGGRPDAATVTLEREEIQEALASDAPLDLILAVQAGDTRAARRAGHVAAGGPRDGAREGGRPGR